MQSLHTLTLRLRQAERVRLFLDYDGTLADFAETPDQINPEPAIFNLLSRFVEHARFRVAVISGRRLSHIEKLIPLSGLILAGTYGLEIRTPEGRLINRLALADIRPTLEQIKPLWENLVRSGKGFYLEDKGWALAIHGRDANDYDAGELLASAYNLADTILGSHEFQLRGGHKFLEVAPELANKRCAVQYLVEHYPWPGAELVYMGDDDKDEDAFGIINTMGGSTIVVAVGPRSTAAQYRLESPQAVRRWLANLLNISEIKA